MLQDRNYLNEERGIRSWLLTTDHKRIGILYMLSITFFFLFGGAAAVLIRMELMTPEGDLLSADSYNRLFSLHGIIMVFFFLIPAIPAVLGNFLIPLGSSGIFVANSGAVSGSVFRFFVEFRG